MQKPRPDASMISRVALGEKLISRDTALAIYKLVIADRRGADELLAQEPVNVEGGGNVWKVMAAGRSKDAKPRNILVPSAC